MAPAVRIAAAGYPMSSVVAHYLSYSHEPIFDVWPESRAALHHPDGTRLAEGDRVLVAGLSDSLQVIADEGPAAFTTGSIGERMAADMATHDGHITTADLAAYRALDRAPIRVPFGPWEVATNPAPAVGGAVLAAMLVLLDAERPDTSGEAGSGVLAEIQRAVLRYRAQHLDTAPDRAAAVAQLLAAASAADWRLGLGSPATVHTSAVDSDGLACAITTSAGYGSGVMIPGTGLWLNNSLGEVELVGAEDELPGPGERLPSNMAPSIARRHDGAVLAIGSPGASRITTAIAQVLLNFVHRGMSLTEAVAHPRLHVEVFESVPTIAHEPGPEVPAFRDGAVRAFPDLSMYFGGVEVALWDPEAGLFGATDPRRTGVVVEAGT
jgi:gamma-glutamyltranspeptidase/glutathione hydrolase